MNRTPKCFPALEVAGVGSQILLFTVNGGNAEYSQIQKESQLMSQDYVILSAASDPTAVPALISEDEHEVQDSAFPSDDFVDDSVDECSGQTRRPNFEAIDDMPSYASFIPGVKLEGKHTLIQLKNSKDMMQKIDLKSFAEALRQAKEPQISLLQWNGKCYKTLAVNLPGVAQRLLFNTHKGKHLFYIRSPMGQKNNEIFQISDKNARKGLESDELDTLLTYFAAWNEQRSKAIKAVDGNSITVGRGKTQIPCSTNTYLGSLVSVKDKKIYYTEASACSSKSKSIPFCPVEYQPQLKEEAKQIVDYFNDECLMDLERNDSFKVAAALYALGEFDSAKEVLIHPEHVARIRDRVKSDCPPTTAIEKLPVFPVIQVKKDLPDVVSPPLPKLPVVSEVQTLTQDASEVQTLTQDASTKAPRGDAVSLPQKDSAKVEDNKSSFLLASGATAATLSVVVYLLLSSQSQEHEPVTTHPKTSKKGRRRSHRRRRTSME